MALAMRCERGHTYVTSDIRSPGDPVGCPICALLERADLLSRLANYATFTPDDLCHATDAQCKQREKDVAAAIEWSNNLYQSVN